MSAGLNVKSGPRGAASSGIPLPHSLLTSSPKTEPRRRGSDLPRLTPKHTPTHSPTHSPSFRPRGSSTQGPRPQASPKGQLLHKRTGALPAPEASLSPLAQRRAPLTPPHLKDTLDVGTMALAPAGLTHDGNRNTFTNQNQNASLRLPLHCRRGTGGGKVGGGGESHGHPLQVNNSNLQLPPIRSGCGHGVRGQSESASQSDEEMGSAEDSSPTSTPAVLPLPSIMVAPPAAEQTVDQELHSPRVNMATVAPFSYRQGFYVAFTPNAFLPLSRALRHRQVQSDVTTSQHVQWESSRFWGKKVPGCRAQDYGSTLHDFVPSECKMQKT